MNDDSGSDWVEEVAGIVLNYYRGRYSTGMNVSGTDYLVAYLRNIGPLGLSDPVGHVRLRDRIYAELSEDERQAVEDALVLCGLRGDDDG
jgi:hypothetical protein